MKISALNYNSFHRTTLSSRLNHASLINSEQKGIVILSILSILRIVDLIFVFVFSFYSMVFLKDIVFIESKVEYLGRVPYLHSSKKKLDIHYKEEPDHAHLFTPSNNNN